MADDAGQTVFAANTYDEYGIPGSGNVGRFQYTGQAWLAELGMYYYKARIYSPSLGRFMQTDPIGYTDRYNLYEYAGDDPVDGTDPTGLCTGTNIDTSNVTNCDNGHDAATMGGCIGNCSGSHTQNLVSSGPETEDEGVRGANLLGIEIDVDGPNREQEFSDAYDKWGQLEPKNPNRDHLGDPNAYPTRSEVNWAQRGLAEAQARQAQGAAARQELRNYPGSAATLRESWGKNDAGAYRALRDNVGRPAGISNRVLGLYRASIISKQYSQGFIPVFGYRIQLINRWMSQ